MPLDPELTEFTTASQILASYDSVDVEEGTGTVLYYGAITKDSSGLDYIATRNAVYSEPIVIDGSQGAAGGPDEDFVLRATYDFDLSPYQEVRTIDGNARIDGSFQVTALSGAADSSAYIIFYIMHNDGTTSTSLGSVQTETINAPSATTTVKSFSLQTAALTNKKFAVGESLRLRAAYYFKRNNSGGGSWQLAADPQNRDGGQFTAATNHTNLRFFIPFELKEII